MKITVVSLLFLGACSSSSSSESLGNKTNDPALGPTAPAVTGTATAPPVGVSEYTMRFEGFLPTEGKDGLLIGSAINLRFSFDLKSVDQTIHPPPESSNYKGEVGMVTPKIITFSELGGFCNNTTDPSVFPPEWLALPAGDPAWVESLDLTMTSRAPLPEDGSAPEGPDSNGMCYGYRMNGVWHWNLQYQLATWDTATSTYRLRFTLQNGPIDAVKVLTNNSQHYRHLDRIVLTVKPQ